MLPNEQREAFTDIITHETPDFPGSRAWVERFVSECREKDIADTSLEDKEIDTFGERKPIEVSEMFDLSMNDIAAKMGLTRSGVNKLIIKGKAKVLRRLFIMNMLKMDIPEDVICNMIYNGSYKRFTKNMIF